MAEHEVTHGRNVKERTHAMQPSIYFVSAMQPCNACTHGTMHAIQPSNIQHVSAMQPCMNECTRRIQPQLMVVMYSVKKHTLQPGLGREIRPVGSRPLGWLLPVRPSVCPSNRWSMRPSMRLLRSHKYFPRVKSSSSSKLHFSMPFPFYLARKKHPAAQVLMLQPNVVFRLDLP